MATDKVRIVSVSDHKKEREASAQSELQESDPFDDLERVQPPDTAQEFEARAKAYFRRTKDPTVNGLALACGINNHRRLWEWGKKPDFADVVEWAKGVIMNRLEQGMDDVKNPAGRIMRLKAMGMSDKGPDESGNTGRGNGSFADVFERSAHAGAAGNVANPAEEV